jgi:hypothetical protein
MFMLKPIINLLLVICLTTPAFSQKVVNDANAEVRTVSGFQSVSVCSGIDLYITPGNEEVVVISAADSKIRDRIKTEVTDGVLRIYIEQKGHINISWNSSRKAMKAYVSYKTLKGILACGGSDVLVVEGQIKQEELYITLSGGSDFSGTVDVSKLKITQSGGSDSDVRGNATRLETTLSGGSDLDAFELLVEECVVTASGGSDAKLNVSTKLVANASGGSDIDVKGKCEITKSTSGASDVRRREK